MARVARYSSAAKDAAGADAGGDRSTMPLASTPAAPADAASTLTPGVQAAHAAAARGMKQFDFGAAHLVSIHASHYCEKARWAMESTGVPFTEESHYPLFIYGATRRHGRGKGRSVPVVRLPDTPDGEGAALVQSSEIVEFCGALPQGRWLYPQEHAAEIREVVDYLDRKLGPHARRWGYQQLLPDRSLALGLLSINVKPIERAMGSVLYPFIRSFVMKGLNITPAKAEESLRRVEAVFDEIGVRAGDSGEGFIVGNAFSAADLTFASLAGMVLLPPQNPSGLPQPDVLPEASAAEVLRLRATPAGRMAMEHYAEYRHRKPAQ